ncbi:hypothetical protein ENSA5_12800 [Enhygromyxa salina]|uniref:DNA mimic protein DMP19 C-terminal domain-containing protein n=1 Tax=Enhygromyxa salina TaxID=215803 RepID=A0A2S9YF48_9BACT|nr:hypothetical protein [Enhygromyxa salina]PRQ03730.1 hypothetical protein ENSA5_12800 [Enhygromyxa salina]
MAIEAGEVELSDVLCLAARGAMPRAASLGLFAEGFVAKTCSTPGTAAFWLRALGEHSGARRHDALHPGLLASAEPPWAPAVVVDSMVGLFMSERDYQNGGADQFVWNHGAALARAIGTAWRAVGAVENGELLLELAAALERFEAAGERESADPVKAFLAYRTRVEGPYFGRPEPHIELGEALVEWAMEHPDSFGAAAFEQG